MRQARTAAELPNEVRRYLAPGERIVLVTHHHWARILEPVATTLLALIIWLFLEANLTGTTAPFAPALRIAFLLVVARLVWRLIDWRHDWIIVTNKRLLRRHGILSQRVPMMPFTKVTDMSYVRSMPGRVLGFGKFVMESAGQEQALRVINWIPTRRRKAPNPTQRPTPTFPGCTARSPPGSTPTPARSPSSPCAAASRSMRATTCAGDVAAPGPGRCRSTQIPDRLRGRLGGLTGSRRGAAQPPQRSVCR